MFRSLAVRNYRTWFLGALVSNVGFWMQRTAQDWIVLTELTDHDAAAVGLTMALQMIPVVVLLPITGYISDRFDRRTVLTVTNSAMSALSLLVGTLVVTGTVQLWHMYVAAVLTGVTAAIENPSKQGFVSELVPANSLQNAVALNSAQFNLARTVGPSVGAALVFVVGAGWAFYANALTFVAMIVAIRLLKRDQLIAVPRLTTWRGSLSSGLRHVREHRHLQVCLFVGFVIGAFVLNFPIFASTMTTIEFHLGVAQYGVLLSCLAVGALCGALLAARRDRPRMAVSAVGGLILGTALAVAAIMPTYWAFAVFLVLSGAGVQTLMATNNATIQLTTAPEVRGRVLALYLAVFQGGTVVGAPIIGIVINHFGPRAGVMLAAVAAFTAATALIIYLIRRRGVGLRVWRAFGRTDAVEELALDELSARRL